MHKQIRHILLQQDQLIKQNKANNYKKLSLSHQIWLKLFMMNFQLFFIYTVFLYVLYASTLSNNIWILSIIQYLFRFMKEESKLDESQKSVQEEQEKLEILESKVKPLMISVNGTSLLSVSEQSMSSSLQPVSQKSMQQSLFKSTYKIDRNSLAKRALSAINDIAENKKRCQETKSLKNRLQRTLRHKSNINRMFYNADDDNQSKILGLILQGYEQLVNIINVLYKINRRKTQLVSIYNRKKKKQAQNKNKNNNGNGNRDDDYLKQSIMSYKKNQKVKQKLDINQIQEMNSIYTPEMALIVNKFKQIFQFGLDKMKKQTNQENPNSSPQSKEQGWLPEFQQETILQILQVFQSHEHRQDFLNLLDMFANTCKNNRNPLDNIIFDQIAKAIAPKFKHTIYLPTIMRVSLAGVNWMDKQNDIASLALKLEIRINIPGFFNFPNIYTQLLRQKFQISLKTVNHSYLKNIKVNFKDKGKGDAKGQIIKGNDIFNDDIKKSIHKSAHNYFTEVYKWKNYYSTNQIYFKKIRNYEGCIIEARVNDVKVLLNSINETAPFEMIDFSGIIELQSISTTFKDWGQVLYGKLDTQFRRFLEKMSPNINIKFNIISLNRDEKNIVLTKQLNINQIHAMDHHVQKDGYHLAQKLMLLEPSKKRQSHYELKRSWLKYEWKKIPEKKLEQMKYIQYKKIKKHYLISSQQNNKKVTQFKQFLQQNFQQKELTHQIVQKLYQYIINICQNEQYQPKQQKQLQDYLIRFSKLQGQLLLYQLKQQNLLEKEAQIKRKVVIEYAIGFVQKVRLKLRVLTEFIIKKLYQKKKDIRKKLLIRQKTQKQIETAGHSVKIVDIIKENQDQIKQIEKYLHEKLLQDQQIVVEKQTKYDHNFNQSKAIFHFPFYRDPGAILLQVTISSFVLSLINLAIFYQDMSQFESVIASCSSLMISFIGMITIVQKQIGSKSISILQVFFYLQFVTPIVSLYYSFRTKTSQTDNDSFIPIQSLYYTFCLLVTILGLIMPILLFIRFNFLRSNSTINTRTLKQSQAINTLFPGTQDVDRIVFQKGSFQWDNKRSYKTLHETVLILVLKYLIKIYRYQFYNKEKDLGRQPIILEFQRKLEKIINKNDEQLKPQFKRVLIENKHISPLAAHLKNVLTYSQHMIRNMLESTKLAQNQSKKLKSEEKSKPAQVKIKKTQEQKI